MIGTVVGKVETESDGSRGYVAMLAVNQLYRKRGIGSKLASLCIERMIDLGCDEVYLEAEVSWPHSSSILAKTTRDDHLNEILDD